MNVREQNPKESRSEQRAEFWSAEANVELPREVVAAGLSFSTGRLEQLAIRGGGPSYRKFGRRCLYRKRDVMEWLDEKSQRVENTSQLVKRAPETHQVVAA